MNSGLRSCQPPAYGTVTGTPRSQERESGPWRDSGTWFQRLYSASEPPGSGLTAVGGGRVQQSGFGRRTRIRRWTRYNPVCPSRLRPAIARQDRTNGIPVPASAGIRRTPRGVRVPDCVGPGGGDSGHRRGRLRSPRALLVSAQPAASCGGFRFRPARSSLRQATLRSSPEDALRKPGSSGRIAREAGAALVAATTSLRGQQRPFVGPFRSESWRTPLRRCEASQSCSWVPHFWGRPLRGSTDTVASSEADTENHPTAGPQSPPSPPGPLRRLRRKEIETVSGFVPDRQAHRFVRTLESAAPPTRCGEQGADRPEASRKRPEGELDRPSWPASRATVPAGTSG